jgi:hypothetical protein
MLEANHCANCALAIAGPEQKFCPACGQDTPAHRIDWHFLGHEFEHTVLHMDRGIFYSLKQLMLRPGHLMRDYIQGRRAGQVKPLLLLTMMAAVVVVLSKYLTGHEVMVAGSVGQPVGGDATAIALQAQFVKASMAVTEWMSLHFAASTLLLLPFEAAAFRLAFLRVGRLNYPEWLVIATFLTVQTFVFWAVLVALHRWVPQTQLWALLLSMAYGIFSLVQFFQGYPRWKSALRTLLGFGIFMLINLLLVQTAVVGVVAILMDKV